METSCVVWESSPVQLSAAWMKNGLTNHCTNLTIAITRSTYGMHNESCMYFVSNIYIKVYLWNINYDILMEYQLLSSGSGCCLSIRKYFFPQSMFSRESAFLNVIISHFPHSLLATIPHSLGNVCPI